MSDLLSGHNDIAKHHIKLTALDARPISSGPYGTQPKARKFEKVQIDKMPCMTVTELGQLVWASSMIWPLERTVCYDSVSTTKR